MVPAQIVLSSPSVPNTPVAHSVSKRKLQPCWSLVEWIADRRNLGPGSLSKYADHLPLFREAQLYARQAPLLIGRRWRTRWGIRSSICASCMSASAQAVGRRDDGAGARSPSRHTKSGQLWAYAADDRPWDGSRSTPARELCAHLSGIRIDVVLYVVWLVTAGAAGLGAPSLDVKSVIPTGGRLESSACDFGGVILGGLTSFSGRSSAASFPVSRRRCRHF